METLKQLYIEQLQDLYSAETQLLEALPSLALKANTESLETCFRSHIDNAQQHIQQLEALIHRNTTEAPGGHTCHAMTGLIRETGEALRNVGSEIVVDVHLLSNGQRVVHYQIVGYDVAAAIANALDKDEDNSSLKECHSNCKDTLSELEKIADGGLFSTGLIEKSAEN